MKLAMTRRASRILGSLGICILVLSSCGTPPPGRFRTAMLVGVVVDSTGGPVAGATVELNRLRAQQTGIDGRFAFDKVRRGTRELSVSRDGYEEMTVEVEFTDRRQLAYVRLVSKEALISRAVEHLEAGDTAAAAETLSRAEALGEEEPDIEIAYLSAIIAYRNGDVQQAVEALEPLHAHPRFREAAQKLRRTVLQNQ
ncbi:MAG: carboxypeptidase regulatory-like domain-containing protein [Spirochaetota bacterium]